MPISYTDQHWQSALIYWKTIESWPLLWGKKSCKMFGGGGSFLHTISQYFESTFFCVEKDVQKLRPMELWSLGAKSLGAKPKKNSGNNGGNTRKHTPWNWPNLDLPPHPGLQSQMSWFCSGFLEPKEYDSSVGDCSWAMGLPRPGAPLQIILDELQGIQNMAHETRPKARKGE